MLRSLVFAVLVASTNLALPAQSASLVWQLPEDGTTATFRGTYSQLVRRTDATQQNVDLSWTRILTVRSVGTEQGTYRGEDQACRWLEFEQSTGQVVGGQVQAGPGGRVIVKVLVPEALVLPDVTDEIGIPVSAIPIVKGWKQIDDNDPVELTSAMLDLTPEITLLGFPRSLAAGGSGGTIDVGSQNLATSQWVGQDVVESTSQRTNTDVELWRSADAPFGVAKWNVSVEVESKGSTSDRSEFSPADEVSEEMTLVEIGTDAVSRLQVP